MPGLYFVPPTAPGLLLPAKGLWVADQAGLRGAVGVLQPVVRAWVRDAGTFKQVWPPPPELPRLTVTNSPTGDWTFIRLTVDAPGATSYSIWAQVGSGDPKLLYNGTSPSYVWPWFNDSPQFVPEATVTYTIVATNATGDSQPATASVKLPNVPMTSTPTVPSTTSSSITLSWTGILHAASYEVLEGGILRKTVTTPTTTITGLAASSSHTYTVRAKAVPTYLGAATFTSPMSAPKTGKCLPPLETGPDNGVYRIEPTSNATWTEENGWRPTSDDLYHGTYSSTNGAQRAFFFYGSRLASVFPDGLGTKTVTKLEIYIKRFSSGGSSAGQDCHWVMHKYTSKPSGTPAVAGSLDAGNLAWGDGEWITLTTTWGRYMVDHDTYIGFGWGGVSGRYMSCDSSLGLSTPNGTIRITIAD